MRRHEVSDETWEVIAPLLPGKKKRSRANSQEQSKSSSMLYSGWRKQVRRGGTFQSDSEIGTVSLGVFVVGPTMACGNVCWKPLVRTSNTSYSFLTHQSFVLTNMRLAEKRAEHEALGRSRGGYGTKIHAAVNEHGTVVKLDLTGGERHDLCKANELIADCVAKHVVGDKGYDSDQFRAEIRRQRAKPAIPSRRSHRRRKCPKSIYRQRNIVERFFGRIKHFVASR